jgi:hypothetical protein
MTRLRGRCGFVALIAGLCCFARRDRPRHWARSAVSICGNEKEQSVWLLRPLGSFEAGRRLAARQRALADNGAASPQRWRALGAVVVRRMGLRERQRSSRSSCRASSSGVPALGRRRAVLRVVCNVIALANRWSGESSFAGPSNSALEPSLSSSCAIMSPRRAAQRESLASQSNYRTCMVE